jgi:hypothetical protein
MPPDRARNIAVVNNIERDALLAAATEVAAHRYTAMTNTRACNTLVTADAT